MDPWTYINISPTGDKKYLKNKMYLLIIKGRYVLEKVSFYYKCLFLKIGLKSYVLFFFCPKTG